MIVVLPRLLARLATIFAALAILPFPAAAQAVLKSEYVEGYDAIPLAVSSIGPEDAPEILFLHGLGHARDSYALQMESSLAQHYRMVSFDLRGHGQSGKPWRHKDYADPAIWAEDVRAVMAATGLRRPIVVAWSYGGVVAADILRVLGQDSISGIVLVNTTGNLSKMHIPEGPIPADLAKAYAQLATPTVSNQVEAVSTLSHYLVADEPGLEWAQGTERLGLLLPPYVRSALRAHYTDNADLPAKVSIPILLVHGSEDINVTDDVVRKFLATLQNSSASRFEGAGHSPFAEDPDRFNRELATFTDQNWRPSADASQSP